MPFRTFVIQALVAFFWTQPVFAQQAASAGANSWDDVSRQLKPGMREEVLLLDGSVVSGTFVRTFGGVLEIRPKTRYPVPATQVPFDQVSVIRQGSSDSLVNGGVLGFVAGFGGTLAGFAVSLAAICPGCHYDPAWYPYAWSGLAGGIGAGVGMVLDARNMSGQHVIYTRRSTTSPVVRAMPIVNRDRKGVMLSIGF